MRNAVTTYGSQMALVCPDCGQEAAYARVPIYVDPDNTSEDALAEAVSDIVGATAEDFDDYVTVVCAECEAEVPFRLAFAATVRTRAHRNSEEEAMAYRHALAGIVHFFGRLPMTDRSTWTEEQTECYDATVRLFSALDEADTSEESSEEE